MLRGPMTSLPAPVQSVLELFQGPLASVRFAGIDAAGLAGLAAEVEAAASQVREHESQLAELRQVLALRQEALLVLAQQALAYARVYAENDEALLEAVNGISLPRAAKPRKAPSSKGSATRADGGERSTEPSGEQAPDALDEAGSSEHASAAGNSEASAEAGGDEPMASAASAREASDRLGRGTRKGRVAVQRAAH